MIKLDQPKISIYLTNQCNLCCKHCFIEGNPRNNDFLSWMQIKNILEYFHKNYPTVEFTGGEALLSPYFKDSLILAKKLGYLTGVSTNGVNQIIIDQFTPKLIDKITYSLDGATAKTHDFLRGKGVFDKCISNIKQAIKKGFRTEVVFTSHKLNIKEIPDTIDLLDAIGVKKMSFNFINNRGNATFNQKILITGQDWIDIRKLISKHHKTKQISLRYPVMFTTHQEFEKLTKNKQYFCRLLNPIKVEVYPDGSIYHCCLEPGYKNLKAGRVTDQKVIINTKNEISFANKYKHLSCPIYQTGPMYTNGSKIIPFCVYYKHITKD